MEYRFEKDTLGSIKVPADKLWAAQTQRSLENFKIGNEKMPLEIIRAFAILKMAAASTNNKLEQLDNRRMGAIVKVCKEILTGALDDQFPLSVWQTGSGTHTNMNVNEVIANRANYALKEEIVHPNDHVNMSQSSNDTFPTAMHIAAVHELEDNVLPAIIALKMSFTNKMEEYKKIIKIGRTHLQDAVPLTLGQEISGWHRMLEKSETMVLKCVKELSEIALGGTAVGTGLNTHPKFAEMVAAEISSYTGKDFKTAKNKFHSLTSQDGIVFAHGALKALACNLMKIANDVRWLASGPRCGIGELTIPANEPGSSIMPGKVNPSQCEAMTMVVCQVMGNDVAIGIAASQGNFQLNTFMPVCIYNFLQSSRLLSDAILSFNSNCIIGIKPNKDKIDYYLKHSLMLITALNPYIGYDNASKIAKKAHAEDLTLKEAAIGLKLISEEDFDKFIRPSEMLGDL